MGPHSPKPEHQIQLLENYRQHTPSRSSSRLSLDSDNSRTTRTRPLGDRIFDADHAIPSRQASMVHMFSPEHPDENFDGIISGTATVAGENNGREGGGGNGNAGGDNDGNDNQNPNNDMTEAEIANQNMQDEMIRQGQRMVFWFGIFAQFVALAVGWSGFGVFGKYHCDKPMLAMLVTQLSFASISFLLNISFRFLQIRSPEKYQRFLIWKKLYTNLSTLVLFGIFIAVMVFYAQAKTCDEGLKLFVFWYFLTVVVLFPCFICCGAFALIIALIITRRVGGVAERLDQNQMDLMQILDWESMTEVEKAKECSICTDAYASEPDKQVVKLFCGHIFHKDCVSEWLTMYADTCPLCRAHMKDYIDPKNEEQANETAAESDLVEPSEAQRLT